MWTLRISKKIWGKIKEIVINNAGVIDQFELKFVEMLGKQWTNLEKKFR